MDGEPWVLEVEPDCMAPDEPFTVSVWIGPDPPQEPVEGAFLSAEQARDVAAKLLLAAEQVDANNERVAKWHAEHP